MEEVFTIEFPTGVSENELEVLEAELSQMEEVEGAGSMDGRGVDPQSMMLWVQVASGLLGVVGVAVPIIQKVVEMVRGKGIKGAKITLSDNTSISVDDISAKDLERLLENVKKDG